MHFTVFTGILCSLWTCFWLIYMSCMPKTELILSDGTPASVGSSSPSLSWTNYLCCSSVLKTTVHNVRTATNPSSPSPQVSCMLCSHDADIVKDDEIGAAGLDWPGGATVSEACDTLAVSNANASLMTRVSFFHLTTWSWTLSKKYTIRKWDAISTWTLETLV